ncbi:MAG TPA: hypothetical protein VFP92_00855 [Rhodanobacteraceae bacterium]|nr:hypothetical protein [Rhodanobacteraceae bacterium]
MTTHVRFDKAVESALNGALTLDGMPIGTVSCVMKEDWSADAGVVGAVSYNVTFTQSEELKAWKAAYDAAQTPAVTDPVTTDPPDPAIGTHAVAVTVTDKNHTWIASASVGDDPATAAIVVPFADADGNPHRGLKAWFYADCVEIGANALTNAYDYINCVVGVTYDGQAVAIPPSSKADGTVDFWNGCRSPAIRYGKQVGWDASRIDWSLLMNYDRSNPPPAYDDSRADYTFNGRGMAIYDDMNATGERDGIGPFPEWDVRFILNPSDDSWAVVRRAADHEGGWRMVYVSDPDTGGIVDTGKYPDTGTMPQPQSSNWPDNALVPYGGSYDGDTLIPATLDRNGHPKQTSASPFVPNGQHLIRYGMLAAMITGTARDRDHAAFWANWPLLEINPAYTASGSVVLGTQRRFAWCLYSMFLASYVSSEPDYFTAQVARALDVANDYPKNPFGVWDTSCPSSHSGTVGEAAGYRGFGVHQIGYIAMVLDAVAHKLPDWQPLAQYIGTSAVQWFEKPYYPFFVPYKFLCRDPNNTLLTDFDEMVRLTLVNQGYTDAQVATILAATTADEVYAVIKEKSPTWGGEYVNGVCDINAGTAPDSSTAKGIAQVIGAANVGTPDIANALATIEALPQPPDYSGTRKYHIAPRAAA